MANTWVLVANASKARLLNNPGIKKGLQLVKEFDHPASREKGSELITDRPGHFSGAGNGHGAFFPATEPKQNEAQNFARELAKDLEHGRTAKSYERLILVAPPQFMGILKHALSGHVLQMMSETVEKDYTTATDKELGRHLEKYLFL